jgi:hypothetical protein
MAVALTALVVALGGTGYAAVALPKNSVGPKQLRAKAVTGAKLADGAVTGGKVAADSIGPAQVNEAALGKVPAAERADAAGTADQAAVADRASLATRALRADAVDSADHATTADHAERAAGLEGIVRHSAVTVTENGHLSEGVATCPPGMSLAGGGFDLEINADLFILASNPKDERSWRVHVFDSDFGAGDEPFREFITYVVCAPA